MFESNFPVDKAMCSYPVLWNAFKRVAHGSTATEKAALFYETATRVYQLGPENRHLQNQPAPSYPSTIRH